MQLRAHTIVPDMRHAGTPRVAEVELPTLDAVSAKQLDIHDLHAESIVEMTRPHRESVTQTPKRHRLD
jgi:hypothetical protein